MAFCLDANSDKVSRFFQLGSVLFDGRTSRLLRPPGRTGRSRDAFFEKKKGGGGKMNLPLWMDFENQPVRIYVGIICVYIPVKLT